MPYSITTKDGITIQNIPDDVPSDAQELKDRVAAIRSGAHGGSQNKPIAQSNTPGEVVTSAIKNFIPSGVNYGVNLAKGLYQTVRHPINTASGVLDLAAGAIRNSLPQPIRSTIDQYEINPQAAERASQTASNVGGALKERLGSVDAIKNTIATDPVGFLGDASLALTGGSALARLGNLPKVSGAIQTAANYTNPISAAAPLAKVAGKVIAVPSKNILGILTQTGPESIKQAARSGYAGKPDFFENLSGKANMTDVLDQVKQGLQNMAAQKSAEYRSGMSKVSGDKSVLNFNGIDSAINDTFKMTTFKGQVKNAKAFDVTKEIFDEVSNWKKLNPKTFHTPEGLDALKQKIGGILESIPFEERTARLAAGKIYNSIKSEITKQAPVYAGTMKAYSEASDVIKEIERALLGGHKAAADTGMRKLQSIMRNNVNTNYGNRLSLAKTLEKKGGVDIMPALAGQAMNTWVPRGLAGQIESLGTIGSAAIFQNPLIAAALIPQSPKFVGSVLYGGGKLARGASDIAKAAGLQSQQAKTLSLLLNQIGRPGTGVTSYQQGLLN